MGRNGVDTDTVWPFTNTRSDFGFRHNTMRVQFGRAETRDFFREFMTYHVQLLIVQKLYIRALTDLFPIVTCFGSAWRRACCALFDGERGVLCISTVTKKFRVR
jgi:hypothetical protein